MSRPFFTVAIPTKNRPEYVSLAVRSVLEQTFGELEVVVCDNSDPAAAKLTESAVRNSDDGRVRYVRTNGSLSMPDNWERAIAGARGDFVGILTDRSVFRRNALDTVRKAIDDTDARIVSWLNDLYGRDATGSQFKRRRTTMRRHRLDPDTILDFVVHGHPASSQKIVPKLMTSVCHRSILEAIRASPAGRVCPPVAPDFTSGFLMLAHADWVLMLDEALYVSIGTGNGAEFRRGGELADRFRRDLGMDWWEMVDRMPSDACFAHALVLNDLLRVRELAPDRLGHVEIDRAQYYLGCLNDYTKTSRHGVRRDEDLKALLAALEREPAAVRSVVGETKLYRNVTERRGKSPDSLSARARRKLTTKPPPSFPTIWEALAWDEAYPRVPAPTSFLDELPGLDTIEPARHRGDGRGPGDVRSLGRSLRRLGMRARQVLARRGR